MEFFLAVCHELGIAKVLTTAYHPQTNGKVERFNRTTVNALSGYVAENQRYWDEFTPALTFGCNCRIHASLDLAPFELNLSRPPPPLSEENPEKGQKRRPKTRSYVSCNESRSSNRSPKSDWLRPRPDTSRDMTAECER
jgi:hypothetical protein